MTEPVRDEKGLWTKGASGNPGGRPKGAPWFRAACREHSQEALNALVAALQRPEHAVAAAKVLLEFAWGKAPATTPPDEDAESATPSIEEAHAAAERLRAAH